MKKSATTTNFPQLKICSSTKSIKQLSTNHGEANISFLQGWSIIGTISSDSNHFAVLANFAINNSFNKSVFVSGR